MAGQIKKLEKGDYLFKEGDASAAMYVVKKGSIGIFKAKGQAEVELATVKPGQMLGEMAFFDQKPRSATAKAVAQTEVIELPFNALQAHFNQMPEWLKSMVKTINENLRDANKKIKTLEKVDEGSAAPFPPHTITRLCAIIGMVAERYGEDSPDGVVLPQYTLRNYCIQIFQQPTAKMDRLMAILEGFGIMKVEELGEQKKKITLFKKDFLFGFVEYYNDYLFKDESKRVTVEEKDMRILKALIHFGRKAGGDPKKAKVALEQIQNESMKEIGYVVTTKDYENVISKQLTSEKIADPDGVKLEVDLDLLEKLVPYWELVYGIEKNG